MPQSDANCTLLWSRHKLTGTAAQLQTPVFLTPLGKPLPAVHQGHTGKPHPDFSCCGLIGGQQPSRNQPVKTVTEGKSLIWTFTGNRLQLGFGLALGHVLNAGAFPHQLQEDLLDPILLLGLEAIVQLFCVPVERRADASQLPVQGQRSAGGCAGRAGAKVG